MPKDVTEEDIQRAREAAQNTGDPDIVAKTEQAAWVIREAGKTH